MAASRLASAALALVLLAFLPVPADEPAAPRWKLAWSDEFDGDGIDPKKWAFDVGNGFYDYGAGMWIGGWGNGELQYYTKEPENAFVKDGKLHIVACKESLHGCGWTSARLKTRGKDGKALLGKRYGKFEFRAKLPTGKGVWPALWMLPVADKYGTWATSGEIDVMEARGHQPEKVLGTLHFGGKWPNNAESSTDHPFPGKGRIDEFHTYAVEWEPGEMRWLVDGRLVSTKSFWWSGKEGKKPASEAGLNPWPAPFDQEFYLVMNVAVGGKFPGKPDKDTPFPAEMVVDWVRVYDKEGGYGKPKPRGAGKLPWMK
ncbi:MAG: glycoside hydrolase family 16 protein [Gemmataceae bacterium]|nr:glycoside hydrolase family 16 protein [Gemmataceae bacterium]